MLCGLMAKPQESKVDNISDDRLRESLQKLGFRPGPVTATTRTVLERKLRRLSTDKVSNGAENIECSGELTDYGAHNSSKRRSKDPLHSVAADMVKVTSSVMPTCPITDAPNGEGSSDKDIFLSYSRETESTEFVTKLKKDLESAGYSVWMDAEDIHTGADWHSAIGQALKNCKALIAVITTRYLASQYCKKELFMASSERKLIFPVVLGDVDFNSGDGGSGVLYVISSLNRVSFEDADDQRAFSKLLEGLKCQIKPSVAEKPLKKFTVDEVCLFVEGLEISSELFKASSVSGEDLSLLTDEDFINELKLKPLQVRKLRRHMEGSK